MGSPALTIAALSRKELQILTGPPNVGEDVLSAPNGTVFDYNPSGTGFVHCHEKEISFYENTDAEPIRCRSDAPISRIFFSPTGLSRTPARVRASLCLPFRACQQRSIIVIRPALSLRNVHNVF
jgi:hypothetical protein